MSDLVSVIIPSFNHERFITKACESIYGQDYENIELIIIDDCSSDDTLKKAEEFLSDKASRFERIILQRNDENLGAHETINKGVKLAKGEFITILNSDDFYHPERLKRLVELSREKKENYLLFTGVHVVNESENRAETEFAVEIESSIDMTFLGMPLSWIFLIKNIAISTGNLFFRRELIEKIGYFRKFKYIHDWDFVVRSCFLEEPVCLPEPLYYYREHTSQSYIRLKKIEKYLETIVLYRYIYSAFHAGIIKNPNFLWEKNYKGLIEIFFDQYGIFKHFKNAYPVVGGGLIKYDAILKSINYWRAK